MPIKFITSNENKFKEIQAILSQIEMARYEAIEIQELDAKKIIEMKLGEAGEVFDGPIMVEDTSLYLLGLNGLPGPLIKWFLKAIGNEGVANLAKKTGNNRAKAETIIGYRDKNDEINFFEGSVSGKVVSPRGEFGFGWDPIFVPDGHEKTFAEMDEEEKTSLKMRRIAALKLKEFLASNR